MIYESWNDQRNVEVKARDDEDGQEAVWSTREAMGEPCSSPSRRERDEERVSESLWVKHRRGLRVKVSLLLTMALRPLHRDLR